MLQLGSGRAAACPGLLPRVHFQTLFLAISVFMSNITGLRVLVNSCPILFTYLLDTYASEALTNQE
jgi:hypothetical protein